MEDLKRTPPASPWMTTVEAASYLKLKPNTLKTFRSRGSGPRYAKVHGVVRYHVDALDRWLEGESA